jgi:hypothetical protein
LFFLLSSFFFNGGEKKKKKKKKKEKPQRHRGHRGRGRKNEAESRPTPGCYGTWSPG